MGIEYLRVLSYCKRVILLDFIPMHKSQINCVIVKSAHLNGVRKKLSNMLNTFINLSSGLY